MRRFRPRFTLRWLMAAVVIAGVAFAIPGAMNRRRTAFLELARSYSVKADRCGVKWHSFIILRWPRPPNFDEANVSMSKEEIEWSRRIRHRGFYYLSLSEKYREAADRPWLPVWPDPPEP